MFEPLKFAERFPKKRAMSGHDHGHDHSGGCCHSADDVESADNIGLLYSLYSKIDLENLTTLNEEQEGSGKSIFRSWDERLSKEKVTVKLARRPLAETIGRRHFAIGQFLIGSLFLGDPVCA